VRSSFATLDVSRNRTLRIIVDNRPAGRAVLSGGSIEVPLSPKGSAAMLISGGSSLTSAYLFLGATGNQVREAKLH
jgi:hypothetical protein